MNLSSTFTWSLVGASLMAMLTPAVAQSPVHRHRVTLPRKPVVLAENTAPASTPSPTRQLLVKLKADSDVSPDQLALRVNHVFPFAKFLTPKALTPFAENTQPTLDPESNFPITPDPAAPTLTFLRSIPQIKWHVFEVPDADYVRAIRDAIRLMPEVEDVCLDQRIRLLSAPTNPKWGVPADEYNFAQLLTNLGIDFTPTRDYDSGGWNYSWHMEMVNAVPAWENYPGSYPTAAQRMSLPNSRKPLVAVLDTGLDLTHPGFMAAGGSSTDSGAGGQIATSLGVDYYNGTTSHATADIMDVFGHGTSVAGVIAAAPNNGVGIPGLGFPARIVPVRIYGANGDGQDSDLIRGITYATDAGCVLINISARTDLGYSRAGQDAVDYAWQHNTLVVAAMGNDGSATDANAGLVRRYPAGYNKVLAVGATTYSGNDFTYNGYAYTGTVYDETLASYSSYGQNGGVVAPAGDATLFYNSGINQADDIWSAVISGLGYPNGTVPEYLFTYTTAPTYTVPLSDATDPNFGAYAQQGNYGLNYGSIPGTSFACPLVVGLAALYCAKNNISQATPNAPQRILQAIERGSDNIQARPDGGFDLAFGWGRINAQATLNETNNRGATVGGIVGIVLDGSTVIGSNEVYLDSTAAGSLSATTTPDGVFHIINAMPGAHTLITSVNGTTLTQNITVTAGCDVSGVTLMKAPAAVQVTPQNIQLIYGRKQTFSATVTGLSNNQVAWSLPLHNGGTLTSAGVLTAPASAPSSSTEIVAATSLANPSVVATSLVTYVPLLTGFTVGTTSVSGGNGTTATLTFNATSVDPVPIVINANNSAVSFPATVTLPAGATSVKFPITVPTTLQSASTTLTATLAGVSKTVNLTVSPGYASSVSGVVTLQAALNKAQIVTFLFRPTDNTPPITASQTLNANGSYTVPNLPQKNYNVWIKGEKWLAKVVTANASGGNVTGVNATLLAGDADNNNVVDVDDLTLLLFAFNSKNGDGIYDARCDFDGNGLVDVDDLTDLLFNFNIAGDN